MKSVSIHKPKFLLLFLLGVINIQTQAQDIWSLNQCIDFAIENNAKLKIDKNNNLIVAQKEKEIKSNLIPKVSLNGDYKYYFELPTQLMPMSVFGGPEEQYKEAQFGVPHNINANIQLSMPLYSPELYGGIEKVKLATEISELQLQKTKEQLMYDVSYYYFNAQILKSQINFIEGNLKNTERLFENVQLLHEQLLLTKTDEDKIALKVQLLITKKEIVNSKYRQVINGLKLQLGMALNEKFEIEPHIEKEAYSDFSLQETIDMKLVNKQYEMLNSDLSTLQKKRFLPSAYLYGSYGTMGYGFSGETNEFLNFYNMGFTGVKVSYPLFNGMVKKHQVNQKKIELENNIIQQSLIKDKSEMQIDNAILQLNVAQETYTSSLIQIELAQSIYNQVLLQQKEGVASLTEVILADVSLSEVQQNNISAIIDYLKSDLELKRLTGNIK
jgi:OMF family outer membrane factor